jgi:N-acetylneuraminate lyase
VAVVPGSAFGPGGEGHLRLSYATECVRLATGLDRLADGAGKHWRKSVNQPIRGVLAASLTPLTEDGERLDEAAFAPMCSFFSAAGLDGILAMGTTGEGVLLDLAERTRIIDLFVAASGPRLKVVAHCGAQTTRDTVALSAHAAQAGADGVAVISPPYFVLDDDSLLRHLRAAADACAPLPFYIYEFAARSGYSVPLRVVDQLRQEATNLAGLKVSDTPWERFEPYLIEGLSIFVGPERLIWQGRGRGAVGAVSALAAALPELVIEAVGSGSRKASERCFEARAEIERFPFHSALKAILAMRGVPVSEGVRQPLRRLSAAERAAFEPVAARLVAALPARAGGPE